MVKKSAFVLLLIVFLACFSSAVLQAQDSLTDLKKRLRDVKSQIAKETDVYKDQLAEVKKDSDNKLLTLKKAFHKDRDQYINERKAKEKALLDTYTQKITPLREQEKDLINQIEPRETDNFVKHR